MESHYLLSSKFAESPFSSARIIHAAHTLIEESELCSISQPWGSAEMKISRCPAVTRDKSCCPHSAIRANLSAWPLAALPARSCQSQGQEHGWGCSIAPGLSPQPGKAGSAQFTAQL